MQRQSSPDFSGESLSPARSGMAARSVGGGGLGSAEQYRTAFDGGPRVYTVRDVDPESGAVSRFPKKVGSASYAADPVPC
ncbi:MAG: hypothetical protein GY788_12050 [bacterium]|nr:hypothetical protein [bacterium]